MVSEELVRCAILWHEQWHDALDEASRQYFQVRVASENVVSTVHTSFLMSSVQEKNTAAMMETLEPVHKMIEKGPTTLKEQSFNQVNEMTDFEQSFRMQSKMCSY